MSNISKIIIGLVVVVLIAGGVWWYMNSNSSVAAPATDQTSDQINTDDTTYPTTSTGNTNSTNVSANTASDASIGQDTTNIDSQMSGLNGDNASADQGLNGQ